MREIMVAPFGAVLDFGPDGGWRARARQVVAQRASLRSAGRFAELNLAVQSGTPTSAAISGTFRIPAIPFRFADMGTATVFDTALYRQVLYGTSPPLGRPYSLRTYYAQLSNDLLDFTGTVTGWVTLDSVEQAYTGTPGSCSGNPTGTSNCNGIFSVDAYDRMTRGLREALAKVDAAVDFSVYDGDGNGVVDFVLFLHSELDGSCGGATNNHIWAHRSGGLGYVTNDPRPGGGTVVVSDYIIQSAVGGPSCDPGAVMAIGTVAHESGHAFGLPDLYDTQGSTEGIGRWGLMGSGNWSTQESPARMEAWSLDRLGWVTLAPATASGTYSIGAAPVADSALLVRVQTTNPRGEYFLIENRQGVQSDTAMIRRSCDQSGRTYPVNCAGGLGIWQIDSAKIVTGGAVNSGAIHGVALVQADGLNQLRLPVGSNRGDGGDLYPGIMGNTVFGPFSSPAGRKNSDGDFVGFTIDSIRQLTPGGSMTFRLRFGMPLTVTATGPGTVTSNPAVPADTLLLLGSSVTLTAVASAGGLFQGWGGDTTAVGAMLVLTMNRPWRVQASFVAVLAAAPANPPAAVMGANYLLPLGATGGTGTYTWALQSGALPDGLAVRPTGAIAGIPEETGSFPITVRVTSGSQTADQSLTLSVGAPALTTATVLGALLGTGGTLTADEIRYLDLLGNRNGQYDVGDFRAFIDKTGGAVTVEMVAELLRKESAR